MRARLLSLVLALAVAVLGPAAVGAAPSTSSTPSTSSIPATPSNLPASAAPAARAAAAPSLRGPATATSGGTVVLRGKARARGLRVVLQRRLSGSWKGVTATRSGRYGRFAFRVRMPATTARYRVKVAPRWSPVVTVAVRRPLPDGPGPLTGSPWVTGYYAGWFWDQGYAPHEVDMSAMTHFVFGRVAPGGGSLGGSPGTVVRGAGTAHDPAASPYDGVSVEDHAVRRAHAAGTKALLMLGGDGFDGRGFVASTRDDVRATFVDNVVDYLVAHDYDGVDVDWENCIGGPAGQCGVDITEAEAVRRLTALIRELRAEMATRPRYATTPGLITFPGYAVSINETAGRGGRVKQWQADVANLVDQYNLMTYGVGTTWNGDGWHSWFSGALDGESGTTPMSIDASIDAYEATGVPRARIGLGIGFYGIYYGPSIDGPRQSTAGNDIYEINDVALSYANLRAQGYLSHGTRHFDDAASSTYRVYGGAGFVPAADPRRNPAGFLSYEDEQSIAAKAAYVRRGEAGGAIVWTLNYGALPDDTNPLLAAVKQTFLDR
ncbi:glycoside hydrolase family 18 protein [Nocardioides sp. SYSU DS0651]|uniref:glycoside hydrolase family 18 protein n=1 Tax=Nocardioides sp. SYSU DS0651 TaxID=3415955 RepID=UPI003F4C3D6E